MACPWSCTTGDSQFESRSTDVRKPSSVSNAINASLFVPPRSPVDRQWSGTSDYVKNWPYEWHIDASTNIGIPKDPAAFFMRFFQEQEGWGLAMYEQDWLMKQVR